MGLITLKKFLCCIKLETGGKILGWLSIVSSGLSVITFASLIFISNIAIVYVNDLHNDITFRDYTLSPNSARIALISECAREHFRFEFNTICLCSRYRGFRLSSRLLLHSFLRCHPAYSGDQECKIFICFVFHFNWLIFSSTAESQAMQILHGHDDNRKHFVSATDYLDRSTRSLRSNHWNFF